MKANWAKAYMDTAERFAEESYAVRLKVGSIAVKDDRIISIGINGTPSGWDNCCEDRDYLNEINNPFMSDAEREESYPYQDEYGFYKLVTRPEVLHAEANCLSKLSRTTESAQGAALFVTHSPCMECSKMIFQAGIKSVYYRHAYRCDKGLNFLEKCGIEIQKI